MYIKSATHLTNQWNSRDDCFVSTSRARKTFVATASAAIAGLLVWVWFASGWETTGKVAGAATAVIGVMSTVAARWPRRQSAADPATALEASATAVREQWQTEEKLHRLADPRPLPLRWTTCARDGVMDYWEVIRGVEGRETPIDLDGRLDDIIDIFERIPSRRLVVLGEPGAGKSVLAMHFTLAAVRRRGAGDPVPVLFPVASWNPRTTSLTAWMEARLCVDYPILGGRTASGQTPARELILRGLIWPVLDGLDEAPEQIRPEVITALNRALSPGQPIMLTCRSAEYEAAVAAADDVVTAAAVIELTPLGLDEITSYLRVTTAPGRGADRWDTLFTHLRDHPGGELAAALTTPLMTSLARVAYSDRRADPSELLDTCTFADRETIEAHLLDQLIPSSYTTEDRDEDRDGDTEQRLRFLAADLEQCGERDLAWWKQHLAIPTSLFRVVSGLGVGLLVAIVAAVSAWPTVGFTATEWANSVDMAVRLGFLAAVVIGFLAPVGDDVPRLRTQAALFTLIMTLGTCAGLAVGALTYWARTDSVSATLADAISDFRFVAESSWLLGLVVFLRVRETGATKGILGRLEHMAGIAAVVGIVFGFLHGTSGFVEEVVLEHGSTRDGVIAAVSHGLTVGAVAGIASAIAVQVGRALLRPVYMAGTHRIPGYRLRIFAAVTVTMLGGLLGAVALPLVRDVLGTAEGGWDQVWHTAQVIVPFALGHAVIVGFLPWESRPMTLELRLRGRLLRLLAVTAIAGTAAAVTLWFAIDFSGIGQAVRSCVLAGVLFGLAVGALAVAMDRPVALDRPVGPLDSLRLDRRAALLYSLAYSVAAGAATWLHTAIYPKSTLGAEYIGMFAASLFLVSYFVSASGRHTIATIWLWLAGRMPLRDMRFYDEAYRRGVLRQVGSVYQFRHALLQDRLAEGNRHSLAHSGTRAALVLVSAVAVVLSGAGALVHYKYQHLDSQANTDGAILPFVELAYPVGVAVDGAGTVYVAGVAYSILGDFTYDNMTEGQLWRLPKGRTDPARIPLPELGFTYAMTVDRTGTLYIADSDYDHVLALSPGSTTPITLPFPHLGSPVGVAVGDSGDVYVSDNDTGLIWKLPAGSTTAKTLPFPPLDHVTGLAVDSEATVYAVEAGPDRVLALADGATTATPLPIDGLENPTGIAIDSTDTLYVCSWNGRVARFRTDSASADIVPLTGVDHPTGIAIDGANTLYVTDPYNNRVIEASSR
ncbi:NACHT domain-containing protein [Nocardia aurea]|uniref:NACHT domain-containing protein n=1 Tax=Nocardia aurea TaxID=2144174 RepID=UPI0033A25D00